MSRQGGETHFEEPFKVLSRMEWRKSTEERGLAGRDP